jgi:hypothetical protein
VNETRGSPRSPDPAQDRPANDPASLYMAILFYISDKAGCENRTMKEQRKIWVTLSGLPLTIALEWPFHRSTSGADFWVLHADIRVEGSDGLHALVAVNLSATVREVLPSLEPKDAEAPVINALRKEVDRKQIEFVKQAKLLPLAFSSRHYDFKRQKWVFGKASDEEIATFLERKVYWETKAKSNSPPQPKDGVDGAPALKTSGDTREIPRPAASPSPAEAKGLPENAGLRDDPPQGRVWIGDPTEAQYLETSPGHLVEVAGRLLAGDGLLRMEGEWAEATPELMGQTEKFENAMRGALEEVEKKRAFERA